MMKETAMDIARFEALADAYGADLRRWPAAERAGAEALLSAEPRAARARLTEADALDDMLSLSRAPVVRPALREAVIAGAPKARAGAARRHGLGFWLSGAGLAAAGVAGLLVGTAASNMVVNDVQTEAVLAEALPDEAIDILPLSRAPSGDVV